MRRQSMASPSLPWQARAKIGSNRCWGTRIGGGFDAGMQMVAATAWGRAAWRRRRGAGQPGGDGVEQGSLATTATAWSGWQLK